MKKYLILGSIILVACVCLTGCAFKETKLVCQQSISGVDVTFNVFFKGNVVNSMDVSYNMNLSSYSDVQIEAIEKQDFCSTVKAAMGTYRDGFENCKQDVVDKTLHVTANLNVSKFSSNILDTINSPKLAKTSLEQQGYFCTLK